MSIAARPLDEISAADIEGASEASEPLRLVVLDTWSRERAEVAANALANARGGLVVVRSGANLEDLVAVGSALDPSGRQLVRARVLEEGGRKAGLIAVSESASLPVLVAGTGAIYRQTEAGPAAVSTRASLDELVVRDQLNRKRAENNAEGMIGRVAFGHFSYMTVAVVAAPRINTAAPYMWARENRGRILQAVTGFPGHGALSDSDFTVEPGEIVLSRGDDTVFFRVSRNGSVAAGMRQHRPAQGLYLAPAELAKLVSVACDVVMMPFAGARAGLTLGSVFLESVRDLRLPVEGGATAPVGKDLVQEYVGERYLDDASECGAFRDDLLRAAGEAFNADLRSGAGEAYTGAIKDGPDPKNWHGLTRRTERRLAGLRGHGSGH
ncbi:MAG: hypothetical protein HUU14_00875 [Dehalococcoidia bacterium]|nr:hypothetical protein [Chloroflexi bacterium CFX7]MCK6564280.1 hypothetical protein [Dehalococcoidia bacterium]NUQ54422.1 hypothetical protein [Dehalococcoidia bacterium]